MKIARKCVKQLAELADEPPKPWYCKIGIEVRRSKGEVWYRS